ncbi:MAG TPA: hypothetical protein VM487_16765 [Phycisphaerae bacterium]|nr:hypothetical protein [Phycisphaerae bacterium]
MEGLAQELAARMPLADAVLLLWGWVANEAFLDQLYERHRGRGFTRVLTFSVLVHLLADALVPDQA